MLNEQSISTTNNRLLGIWTPDLSMSNLAKLKAQGFNALLLHIDWFWRITEDQDKTVFWMFSWYENAKKLGYTYFLIDCGWGLGMLDGNYFYKKIIEKFKMCHDVQFYFGEPIEQFIETKQFAFFQTVNILRKRRMLTTCYYNLRRYWGKFTPFVWIYGQLKIGGSLRYKKLSQAANSLNIETRFLYQADLPGWTWYNWIIKLLKIFHLQERFENWQRDRFIKSFK